MKKMFGAVIAASLFVLMSCSNNSNPPAQGEPYEFEDREHFLVLTNISENDIPFANIPSAKGTRSVSDKRYISTPLTDNPHANVYDISLNDNGVSELLKYMEKFPDESTQVTKTENSSTPSSPYSVAVGGTYDFWCYDSASTFNDNIGKQKRTFTLKAEGTKCRIWFRNSTTATVEPEIAEAKFTELATSLDSVFDKEMSIFGSNVISGYQSVFIQAAAGTKLNVLIYDIELDRNPTDPNKAVLGGLFAPTDLMTQSYCTNNINPAVYSNQCETIHADSYQFKNDIDNNGKFVTSTLVHEFQHMLHYINKNIKYGVGIPTWFTEMLSMSAEDIFQTQLGLADKDSPKSRLGTFNANYFGGFKNWKSGNDVLISYANAYAFGAFLMRNYGGVKLINQIATNQYTGEQAITAALASLGYSDNFYTALKKFSDVIIYPTDSAKLNLYKTHNETFAGTNYSLTAINLMNYGVKVSSEGDLELMYDSANRKGKASDGKSVIFGPIILTNGVYYTNGSLGSYGTHVVYLGKLDNAPELEATAGVENTVVIK